MRYRVTVDDLTYDVDIDASGQVRVDGEEIEVDVTRPPDARPRSLLVDRNPHDVAVRPASDRSEENAGYEVQVAGRRFSVEVEDVAARQMSATRARSQQARELSVVAPLPGLITRVLVAPGQRVAEGDVLLVLEAMKMENEMRAPRGGIVNEVRVAAGVVVGSNDILLTIE